MNELDLSLLTDDGDICDLGNGHFVRLRVGIDFDTKIDDFDCYGRVGWGHKNILGREIRPEGFDGNAQKISILHDTVWWQPPADVQRDTDHFRSLRNLVADLVSFGFKTVTLEYGCGSDAYGNLIVRDYAVIGGVDVVDRETLADLLPDLVAELAIDPQSPMNTYKPV